MEDFFEKTLTHFRIAKNEWESFLCFFYMRKAQKISELVPVPDEADNPKSVEGEGCECVLLAHTS